MTRRTGLCGGVAYVSVAPSYFSGRACQNCMFPVNNSKSNIRSQPEHTVCRCSQLHTETPPCRCSAAQSVRKLLPDKWEGVRNRHRLHFQTILRVLGHKPLMPKICKIVCRRLVAPLRVSPVKKTAPLWGDTQKRHRIQFCATFHRCQVEPKHQKYMPPVGRFVTRTLCYGPYRVN